MTKMQLIMETEKAKAIRSKGLRKYEDKIKKDMKITYQDKGYTVYSKTYDNILIKSFIYEKYQAAIVITVKDMNNGCELSEAIYL